jgi:hypothetical protein
MVIHAGVFYHDLKMVTRIAGNFDEMPAAVAGVDDDMTRCGGDV